MKVKVTHFLLTLFLPIAFEGSVCAQDSLTLSKAIRIALENNLELKKAKLNIALANENVKLAKLALFPSLNVNLGSNYSFGRNEDPFSSEFFNTKIASSSGGLSASVPLFQGTQRLKQILQNKHLLEASKNSSKLAENDLILNVVTAYLQILYNKEVLHASLAQLSIARQILGQEKRQFNAANKTLADLAQSEKQVALAELTLSNAKSQLKFSYLNLLNYLELDPEKQIEVAVEDTFVSEGQRYHVAEVLQKAINTTPSVKLAENQVSAAATAVELAWAGFFPRLSLQAGLTSGFSSLGQRPFLNQGGSLSYKTAGFGFQLQENFNQYIGLNLAIPIFNGAASRINLNKAKINMESLRIAELAERNNFRKIITQAVSDLDIAVEKYRYSQNIYDASKKVFVATEKRYIVGLVSSLTLSQVQTEFNLAEIEMIKARFDMIFKNKIIKFYMGELSY